MARRRRKTRGSPKLDKAKQIIRSVAGRGAQRSKLVQAKVNAAGISTRTYRTARKQIRALAFRSSIKGAKRGRGRWYTKTRRLSR